MKNAFRSASSIGPTSQKGLDLGLEIKVLVLKKKS